MAETEKSSKMEELEREVGSLKHALVQRSKMERKRATVDLGKMASGLNEEAGKLIDAVQPPVKETAEKAGKKIGSHPFVSITAAFAAGILAARLGRKK